MSFVGWKLHCRGVGDTMRVRAKTKMMEKRYESKHEANCIGSIGVIVVICKFWDFGICVEPQ